MNHMKKADCTTHDPNIPESFDARQKPVVIGKQKNVKGFAKGFAKAAMQSGLTAAQAVRLFSKNAMQARIGGTRAAQGASRA